MGLFIEQFILVFNAVVPFFLIMGLGWFMRRRELVNDQFLAGLNRVAFVVLFPLMLFMNIYRADLAAAFNPALVGYFVIGLSMVYIFVWVIAARFIKNKQRLAAFVQVGYRSNYMVLATAIVTSLMGPESLPQAALMVPVVVFLQTALAATVFAVAGLSKEASGLERVKGVLVGVFKMPMIIGSLLGLAVNFSGFTLPVVVDRGFTSLANMAAPAALLGIGGVLNLEKVRRQLRFAIAGTAVKNLIVPAAVIIPAVFLGFSGVELAIIAMFGLAPVATASYVTALEMGGSEAGECTASTLVLSNVVSLFTIVPSLTILGVLGLL
ncbi:MAG: AEC family transporter [Oscillospiraceae bacterium]|nr:AEC family transporter [Oscillospiraceae bacterium]